MRRENNTGTIYKLKGQRRKPWIARVSSYDSEDKRVWQTLGYFETKTLAAIALAQNTIQPLSPRADLTLAELFDEWKKAAYVNLSDSSKSMYNSAYKHLSALENKKFRDLRAAHFQDIINKMDLSWSSMKKVRVLVGLLYKYAIVQDISNKDYSMGIRLPKEISKDREIFSDTEIKLLFKNDGIEYVDSILILIYTGLRIQEMLDLTKFNVDFEKGILRGGLKTDAGKNRIVPIHPKILKYIKKRYITCNLYLFEGVKGGKLNQKHYRDKIYRPILQRLNIAYKTPHSARHSLATMAAAKGVDTLAIQQILGHAKYAFTADRYTEKDIDFLTRELNKV